MAYELNQGKLSFSNSQKQQQSQLTLRESMDLITLEYQNLIDKFSQEIYLEKQIKKEKNEKKSEKLRNIPTFTNLLQKTQLDR
ncbi:unnamed protein product (macronuclear) [Paramecium tetraurelia]|uniref:SPX domain-containing protein n=1 Tax=Paramecium tetraurelia TaxID=5888 RepID=A0CWU5_PARTE|nr:uncharacterized protein GSPATT00001465001 [Paramecium tetraurelia]CAK75262.1 unnamed protein product [Paramecium tetraurelia]|eukprot:XP_001442659.1 hypothetical protein (macronuclear) [Paramecium tetraurelia strain d4-2]